MARSIFPEPHEGVLSVKGNVKNELVHHRRCETHEQAGLEIPEYIEIFFNRRRWHSRLGSRLPAAFT